MPAPSLMPPPPHPLPKRIRKQTKFYTDMKENGKWPKPDPITRQCKNKTAHKHIGCAGKSANHHPLYYNTLEPVTIYNNPIIIIINIYI